MHAIVSFAPPVSGGLAQIGLHGFWTGHFAGRAAPMGAVGPGPVTAGQAIAAGGDLPPGNPMGLPFPSQ